MIDGFSKKLLTFWKMSKARRIAVECDWNSKSSRNVQSWKVSFFNKKQMRLSRKILIFLESLKVAILPENATGIAWIFKKFKVEILGFLRKKRLVCQKKSWTFYKLVKVASLLENAIEFARYLKTFKNLGFFFKRKMVFSKKNLDGFKNG